MKRYTELETNYAFGEIIGKNQKMQHLFTQIQTAAAGDITVLIQGETGTGKELVRDQYTITAREKQDLSLPSIVLQYQPN